MPRVPMTVEQKKAFADRMKLTRANPKPKTGEKKSKKKEEIVTSESDGFIKLEIHKKGQPVQKYKHIIPKDSKSMKVEL